MKKSELKDFLDEVLQYNTLDFIGVIPFKYHISLLAKKILKLQVSKRNNRMGNRTMIIKNSHRMIDLMGNALDFVMSHSEDDLQKLETFSSNL
jgi:hypothetical protein